MSTTTTDITIEALEAFADRLETDEEETRSKLLRLIKAEARILAAREPDAFKARPLSYADEPGHWDNSYPPKQVYSDHNGPRLLSVEKGSYEEIKTSGGYYYSWRAVTDNRGVYVARNGTLYGRETEGTGQLGRFAAHPGDRDVNLTFSWSPLDLDDVSTEALRTVERVLRSKAFPLTNG